VEIKNIASLTGALNAIQYEIDRQTEQYAQNHLEKSPDNKTTRGWDADKNQTFIQREKEGSADYRYFPEPDIPPLEFSDELIESIRATLPQLPDQKIAKYKSWGLSDYDAQLLADNQDFAAAFEKAVGSQPSPDFAKFVTNLFIGPLKKTGISIDKITPIYFKNLFDRSSDLSSTSIKQLIIESYRSGQDPLVIAQEKNLFQLSDTAALEAYARQTMAANPKVVANFQKNPKVIGFLVGQLMKLSRGSANPQLAYKILEKLLLKNNQP
jgi:aspartyl-tRNA(Asn)/glutamyl-tRNA(Gln) amidotransferase subunit B